jgi:transcription initiation factor TFIIB
MMKEIRSEDFEGAPELNPEEDQEHGPEVEENEIDDESKEEKLRDSGDLGVCPECESTHLIKDYDHGELICDTCGLVIEDFIIDQNAEWRAYDSQEKEKRARTGSPMTLTRHDKGLSTEIGYVDRDSNGHTHSRRNRAKFYRLRKLHKMTKTRSTREHNIARALMEISKNCSKMGLPKQVIETAAYVYRKAHAKNLTRGRSIASICAASIYVACRQCNVPRTFEEVADVFQIRRRDISRTYNCMQRNLKLKVPTPTPEGYIPQICGKLGLNGEVRAKTKELLKQASDKGLIVGRSPLAILGAVIYIASIIANDKRTQAQIAEAANVTEVTIRNRYKELKETLDIKINESNN